MKCNLFLWSKAEFSASLLQPSVSHDPSEIILICCSTNISYYQCLKQLCCLIFLWKMWFFFLDELKVQKCIYLKLFFNTVEVYTVTFVNLMHPFWMQVIFFLSSKKRVVYCYILLPEFGFPCKIRMLHLYLYRNSLGKHICLLYLLLVDSHAQLTENKMHMILSLRHWDNIWFTKNQSCSRQTFTMFTCLFL